MERLSYCLYLVVTALLLPMPAVASPLPASSLVAVGDSITAGSRAPIAWPALVSVWREMPVYNQGVAGNTTAQMLARFGDVLATGGQTVAIMGGTNDCKLGWPTSQSVGNVDAMVAQAQGAGRAVVLVGPLPRANTTSAGLPFAPCLLSLRAGLRGYAKSHRLAFVDPWALFGGLNIKLELYEDGTHPDARGAFLLARLFAQTLGWGFPGDY